MSIQFKSITELRAMLDAKSISASELTQESLQLAQKYKELNCFVTMNEELGAKNANSIDLENKTTSMLSGIPLAQKDLFCTEGLRTTCSSKILSNFIPPYTATAVKKLEDAGSITIGKTNMDEFAMGSSNETSFFGKFITRGKKDMFLEAALVDLLQRYPPELYLPPLEQIPADQFASLLHIAELLD